MKSEFLKPFFEKTFFCQIKVIKIKLKILNWLKTRITMIYKIKKYLLNDYRTFSDSGHLGVFYNDKQMKVLSN
jgi:hypothetical protein